MSAPAGQAPGADRQAGGPDGPPVLARDGAVARIRLSRPRQHNRIDPDDVAVLQHAFAGGGLSHALVSDTERRALALTGAGDVVFDWDVPADRVADLDARLEVLRDLLGETRFTVRFPSPVSTALFRAGAT